MDPDNKGFSRIMPLRANTENIAAKRKKPVASLIGRLSGSGALTKAKMTVMSSPQVASMAV
jgi:hypothetical protein